MLSAFIVAFINAECLSSSMQEMASGLIFFSLFVIL